MINQRGSQKPKVTELQHTAVVEYTISDHSTLKFETFSANNKNTAVKGKKNGYIRPKTLTIFVTC